MLRMSSTNYSPDTLRHYLLRQNLGWHYALPTTYVGVKQLPMGQDKAKAAMRKAKGKAGSKQPKW
jgi:hypothetical protein